MKLIPNSATWLALALLLGSCDFESDEDFFVEVEPTVSVSSVSLNDFLDQDTILIFQPTEFAFEVTTSPGKLREIEIRLNERVLFSSTVASGMFKLNQSDLVTGHYQLVVRMVVSSGSGSLADRLGSETKQVWKNWVLSIDVEPPPKPVVTLGEENQMLAVRWQPYKKKNFLKYVVTTYSSFMSNYVEITDPNQSFLLDSGFVGGNERSFYVRTFTVLHDVSSESVTLPPSWTPVAHSYQKSDSLVNVKWSRVRFPGAVAEYQLWSGEEVLARSNNSLDTLIQGKLNSILFGKGVEINFRIKSKTDILYNWGNFYILNPVGVTVKPGQLFFFNEKLNAFVGYTFGRGNLRIYDRKMQLRDSLSVEPFFHVPHPGNNIFAPDAGGVRHIDLATKTSRLLPFSDKHASNNTPSLVSGSNDLKYSYYYKESVLGRTAILDGKTGTTVFAPVSGGASDLDGLNLSPSGRYFTRFKTIYEFTPTGVVQIGSLMDNELIRPDNDDEIISFWPSIRVTSIKDRTKNRSVPFPSSDYRVAWYDPYTHYALCENDPSTTFYLLNIDTGASKQIKLNNSSQNHYMLVNGMLIDRDSGQTMKVL